jgi:hypothetical protein
MNVDVLLAAPTRCNKDLAQADQALYGSGESIEYDFYIGDAAGEARPYDAEPDAGANGEDALYSGPRFTFSTLRGKGVRDQEHSLLDL